MRSLTEELTAALEDMVRQPDYQIYAFDIKEDDYTAIITGNYTQEPLDLMQYVSNINWTPTELRFVIRDEDGSFHPDTGSLAHYLKDGCIVRLKEGDSRVLSDMWPWTFTGALKGQMGWKVSARGEYLEANVTAFSRESTQSYNRRSITSKEYTTGTDLGVMVYDIATVLMGLSDAEYAVPSPVGLNFQHRVNQIAQMEPWNALIAILEAVCMVPWFDGEGRLRSWSKDMALAQVRELPDNTRVYSLTIPEKVQDNVNKVIVTFLDSNLEEVEGHYQCLGSANITTGFFTPRENLDCYWADDKKQRAKNTSLKIIKSVNDNLLPIGSESYEEIDAFHGCITIEIDIWVPTLAAAMLIEYIYLSFEPDWADVPFLGIWPTITWGKLLQAQALVGILVIMMSLGSAQYEVWGIPYDYAYPERQSVAIKDGLDYWQEVEKEIKNDFIGSWDQADKVAVIELIYVCSEAEQRTLVIDDDLSLEPGDVVQIHDGRRIFIQKMSKTIQRGEVPKLQIDGFKVLTA